MKTRVWIFALLVIAALGANLALLSSKVAHTAEDRLNQRRSVATAGLRAQIDLLDGRLSPRLLAASPELVEQLKAPADLTQPMPRPDERALKTALAAAALEPDLLVVASPQGAAVQRKAKGPVQILPASQLGSLPLVRAVLEGARPKPVFTLIDGQLFRVAGAALPQTTGAVVVGAAIDDQLALRLHTQLDAEVTFFDGAQVLASSAPQAERPALAEWIKHPSSSGYGTLRVRAPVVGASLSGVFPLGAERSGWRAALLPLDPIQFQAVVSVSASPYLGWLGRYQILYLGALLGLAILALIWGLLPAKGAKQAQPAPGPAATGGEPLPVDVLSASIEPLPSTGDVPWGAVEDEPSGWHHLGESRAHASEPQLGPLANTPPSAVQAPLPPPPPADSTPPEPAQAQQPAPPDLRRVAPVPPPPEALLAEVLGDVAAAPPPAIEEVHEGPVPAPPDLELIEVHPDPGEVHALVASAPAEAPQAAAGEFSFAGLLDEASEAEAAAQKAEAGQAPAPAAAPPPLAPVTREITKPGSPSPDLLQQARDGVGSFNDFARHQDEAVAEYFPGDEPTRIEAVSAALLDKLREVDEGATAPRTVEHVREKSETRPGQPAPHLAGNGAAPELQLAVPSAAPAIAQEAVSATPTGPIATPPAPEPPAPSMAMPPPPPQEEITTAPQAVPPRPLGDENTDRFAKHEVEGGRAGREAEPEAAGPRPKEPEPEAHPAETWPEPEAAPPLASEWPDTARQVIHPPEPERAAPREPPAGANGADHHVGDITLTNLQMPAPAAEADPDEAHFRETFQQFLATRAQTGEPSERLSYEKFAAKLRKNREDLLARHRCKGVRFHVYVKAGKAAIKASAIK